MEDLSFYPICMVIVFVTGYALITWEHITHINKATIALMMAIICWTIQFASPGWDHDAGTEIFGLHIAETAQVILFLLGALSVVEIISVHGGFSLISDRIHLTSKKKLLWTLGFLAFFLSSVLDNLTTTIVMVTIAGKLLDNPEDRMIMGGGIVIAANAGGAWTPIGDVTTTMLWIGGQLSTLNIVKSLFLPSVICTVVSLFILSLQLKGNIPKKEQEKKTIEPMGQFIFFLGVSLLILVPVFKLATGLPPFMAMIFALSLLWICTDCVYRNEKNKDHLRMPNVLARIDLSGTLFFLGILLCVESLNEAGVLKRIALFFDQHIGNSATIATLIGIASAIVDNVPLVAAAKGMYDFTMHPPDSKFWELIAYCAGTGGSILLIGSAAGVVFMGLEKVNFIWYLRRVTLPAAAGYFAGIGAYLLLRL